MRHNYYSEHRTTKHAATRFRFSCARTRMKRTSAYCTYTLCTIALQSASSTQYAYCSYGGTSAVRTPFAVSVQ